MSGGGPSKKSDPANSAQAPTASCQFKRYVRPKPLEILNLQQEVNPVNPQTSYQVRRPRLGYPALLFTEFGPTKAFDLLMQDRTQVRAINEAQKNEAVPNINREYGWYDPDVVAVEIQVEVKTLGMDNLESAAALLSRSGAETALTQTPAANKGNFIHLYTTTRPLSEVDLGDPESLGEILNLDVKYMDVPVLRFAKTDPAWIDAVFKASAKEGSVLLPTARDIRITLTPIGRPDPNSAYFGAAWAQRGLPQSFDIRSVSSDERALFTHKVGEKLNPADVWRSIYLQADAFPTSNQTEQQKASGNAQQSPGDMVQRLAQAIGLDAKGMSLIAKPGQRAIFSAAKEIRNTLAPDNSSITFATKADLTNHWLSVLSLTLQRDWTWDALHVEAFEIQRRQKNTHDKIWTEWKRVGNIHLSNTLNVNALDLPGPDRGYTKLYFIDAIDPKKQASEHPDTLELEYKVAANFKTGQKPKNLPKILHLKNMTLPVTIPPVQIPKIISAGIALSPYKRSDDYSASEQRQRALWVEFEEPIAHEEDTYFARVLAYGPDPVITNDYIKDNPPIILPSGVPIIVPDEPGLPIDPEWIRAIFPDQAHDQAGMGIMQEMIPAQVTPGQAARHYLLPLPPGLNADSRELFGFFTYEFRVGHKDIWSTARGRYGAELRLAGVQHPAPELSCTAAFGQKTLDVFAPFAVPVHKGRSPNFIKTRENHEWQLETTLWALLYAQAHQADGQDFRNILLGEKPMELYFTRQANDGSPEGIPKDPLGSTLWERAEIQGMLRKWGLPPDAPLSVLVVEMLPTRDGGLNRPLSVNLGMERILRTSPLTVVEGVCCLDC